MLITRHVDTQIAFRGSGIIANFASIWLVAAGVGLATSKSRMRSVRETVEAGELVLWVLLLHVDL